MGVGGKGSRFRGAALDRKRLQSFERERGQLIVLERLGVHSRA